MKYNAKTFNPNKTLKKVREKDNLTQQQFADKIGIKKEKLQWYENRSKATGISILQYLNWCDNYGCDIDYLLGVQDVPHKEVNDIQTITGLNQITTGILKKEKAEKDGDKSPAGVVTGITTADLLNSLVGGIEGEELKDTMLQYIKEKAVSMRLEKTVNNVIDHHNKMEGKSDSFKSVIRYANNILTSIRMITSLSSLKVAGNEQTAIDDDYINFCEKLKKQNYTNEDCKRLFDYLQSRNRIEALKMNCYTLLMRFLDKLSDDSQLKLHHGFMGDLDVSEFLPYEESIDDIEQTKNEILEASWKRKIRRLKAENERHKDIEKNLREGNIKLSAELNSERRKKKELQNQLDHVPEDLKDLADKTIENESLKEENRRLKGAGLKEGKLVKEKAESKKQKKK